MLLKELFTEKLNRTGSNELVIFDIDDTLLHTTAKINVIKNGKVVRSLTNQEFNNYKLQPEEEFDFGEFRDARKFEEESVPIGPMLDKLHSDLAAGKNVVMLTARADFDNQKAVWRTFKRHGVDINKDVHLYRAGNQPGNESPAVKKAIHVTEWLRTGKYRKVVMYDDSEKNLTVFKSLEKRFPQIEFEAHHVSEQGDTREFEDVEQNPGNPIPFPKGTTVVDVSDPYDWYKLGMVISDLDDANPKIFGKGAPSTVLAFGSEEEEHRLLPHLKRLGLKLHDIDRPSDIKKAIPAKSLIQRFENKNVKLNELNVAQTLQFIKQAHGDQLYGKLPYWTHPRAVAITGRKIFGSKFNSDAVKTAFLHDVVEDTHIGLEELSKLDFSPQVIQAVGLLTKSKSLNYKQNIDRIIASGNPLAMMVKYADNYENFTGDKSDWDPERASHSQKKYLMSLNMLGDRLGVKHHIGENFADGRNPQDKGDSKRHGINTKASVSSLRKTAKQGGRKGQLAHWLANMKAGRAKKK